MAPRKPDNIQTFDSGGGSKPEYLTVSEFRWTFGIIVTIFIFVLGAMNLYLSGINSLAVNQNAKVEELNKQIAILETIINERLPRQPSPPYQSNNSNLPQSVSPQR